MQGFLKRRVTRHCVTDKLNKVSFEHVSTGFSNFARLGHYDGYNLLVYKLTCTL